MPCAAKSLGRRTHNAKVTVCHGDMSVVSSVISVLKDASLFVDHRVGDSCLLCSRTVTYYTGATIGLLLQTSAMGDCLLKPKKQPHFKTDAAGVYFVIIC